MRRPGRTREAGIIDAADVPPTLGRRLVGVEGLRGLAAVSVMLGHVTVHLEQDAGFSRPVTEVLNQAGEGLTLFFVLSGFLLFRPFLIANEKRDKVDLKSFFFNRFLRIYPAYFVILIVVGAGLGLAYTSTVNQYSGINGVDGTLGRIHSFPQILTNLLLIHTFFPATLKTGLGVSWSLTAEVCFYLLLPILGMAVNRLTPRFGGLFAGVAVSFGMIFVGLGCRLAGEQQLNGGASHQFYQQWGATWLAVFLRSILCQADLFGLGMLAAVMFQHFVVKSSGYLDRRFRPVLYVTLLVGLLLTRVEREFGFAVACSALLLIAACPNSNGSNSLISRILEAPPFRWLGLVSYSFYLWHIAVLWGVYEWYLHRRLPSSASSGAWIMALIFITTFGLSLITYLGVERPALLMKRRSGSLVTHRSVGKRTVPAEKILP